MDVTIANYSGNYANGGAFTSQTTGGANSMIIAINGTSNADSSSIFDAGSNICGGGHRQVAGSTFVQLGDHTFTTNTPYFVIQGWDGTTVRKAFNGNVTSVASPTFGGAIAPLRINCRGDGLNYGQNKICHMAFYMAGNGGSAAQYETLRTLYKTTIGQGLGLP